MGFVEAALGDAPEEVLAPEAVYDLRIFNQEEKTSQAGRPMIQVAIAIEDDSGVEYQPMNHWLVFPVQSDWEKDTNGRVPAKMMLRNVKRFLAAFSIEFDVNGFDSDDLDGAVGRCLVNQEAADDGEVYNRLRLPRLKE